MYYISAGQTSLLQVQWEFTLSRTCCIATRYSRSQILSFLLAGGPLLEKTKGFAVPHSRISGDHLWVVNSSKHGSAQKHYIRGVSVWSFKGPQLRECFPSCQLGRKLISYFKQRPWSLLPKGLTPADPSNHIAHFCFRFKILLFAS